MNAQPESRAAPGRRAPLTYWWIAAPLLCAASLAQASSVISQATNVQVLFNRQFNEVEFESPLNGTEATVGYLLLDWRDADFAAPAWYDNWQVSNPGVIDGNANEIWLRAAGHSASTQTMVPSRVVSIHLTGDSNDGFAQIMVDNAEVARLNMYTQMPNVDRVIVLVKDLALTVHTIKVNALGPPGPPPYGPDVMINGAAALEPYKWHQPPQFLQPPDLYFGWNEPSVYTSPQIVADDWVCELNTPVTDVHWWGSFLGWNQPVPPPNAPRVFQMTIWTDVPPDPLQLPFSHPGQVVWQHACSDFTWQFVGFDMDPRNPQAQPEACFKFTCLLPRADWFYQPAAGGIYWISIAADYQGLAWFPNPYGWKTRPRDPLSPAPDDAVIIFGTTAPVLGTVFEAGNPLFWPDPNQSWDCAFTLTTRSVTPLTPKWTQPPLHPEINFDATSDIWLPGVVIPPSKYLQPPRTDLSGLHTHDDALTGRTTRADDWICEGGSITDLHWWGNYELDAAGLEKRGSGIAAFHLSIHQSVPGVPFPLPGPIVWAQNVPFAQVLETPTGMTNSESGQIYFYSFTLPTIVAQIPGTTYWFDVGAISNLPPNPAIWRWQEAGRGPTPILNPSAVQTAGGPWRTEGTTQFYDMAFLITSDAPTIDVNSVVADDFYSDGRAIRALRWWGSYFDDRYAPGPAIDPLRAIDGWLLTFHWLDPSQPCPPAAAAAPGSALGTYFAPASAVTIRPSEFPDCLGHLLYSYEVVLEDCCLLCSVPDPRDPATPGPPALPAFFAERDGFKYWLSVQAIVGTTWDPPSCTRRLTGHVPSDLPGLHGDFWGWLSTQTPPTLPVPTLTACLGRVMTTQVPTPDCWLYGAWAPVPYPCMPPSPPIHMSFELLAAYCRGDCDGNQRTSESDLGIILSAWNTRPGDPFWDARADLNPDLYIDSSDLGIVLGDWGCGRYLP